MKTHCSEGMGKVYRCHHGVKLSSSPIYVVGLLAFLATILVCRWTLDAQIFLFLKTQLKRGHIECIYTSILTFESEIKGEIGIFLLQKRKTCM